MESNVPTTITDAIRDHINLFTEADLDFLHMAIYRDWLSESHNHIIFEYFRFVYVLDYWGFISKISPRERLKLAKLFRIVNNITDEDLRGVKK